MVGVTVIAGTARGAGVPLLVVVEAPAGSGVDAADVRQAVSAEIGTPVLAPRDVGGAGAVSDLLIVALAPGEIGMSLRTGADAPVSRTIPSPVERQARLRAIGWLAGNLARDQVTPIVTSPPPGGGAIAAPPGSAAGAETAGTASADAPVEGAPARALPPATEPPPTPQAWSTAPAPAVSAAARARPIEAAPPPGARWAITADMGPAVGYVRPQPGYPSGLTPHGLHSLMEIQRRTSPGNLIVGASLDAGVERSWIGAAAFVGSAWSWRRWFLEATGGLGIAADSVTTQQTESVSSPSGDTFSSRSVNQLLPVPFLRAGATAGIPVSRLFDVVARVGLTAGTGGLHTSFATATAGLRLRIP